MAPIHVEEGLFIVRDAMPNIKHHEVMTVTATVPDRRSEQGVYFATGMVVRV